MNPQFQFENLRDAASDEGRKQYEAALAGLKSNSDMGAEAAQKQADTLEQEEQRRHEIAYALAHQRNIAAALRALK